MGNNHNDWQEAESILRLFADHVSSARLGYHAFMEKGMDQGSRPDLIGGGLLRSAGGWHEVEASRKAGIHRKSDERMLGDGDFVEDVLASKGIGFEQLVQWVSELTNIPVQAMAGPGKERQNVRARSLLCFWSVKELGISLTDLANRLGIAVPTVSVAVQRGMKIVEIEKLEISALLNVKI